LLDEMHYRERTQNIPLVWETGGGMNHCQSPRGHRHVADPEVAAHREGWRGYCHPDDREDLLRERRRSLASKRSRRYGIEARILQHGGPYRRVRLQEALVRVRGPHGEEINWAGTCRDIDETKATRAALEHLEVVRGAASHGGPDRQSSAHAPREREACART
jgi:PAS domain S-box-containing protein